MAADPKALAQFMHSISVVETGGRDNAYTTYGTDQGSRYGVARGKYQIMSKIWDGWAREAGYGDADWRDPYAQEAVVAYKMGKYWDKYQDWDLVAVAWFSGVGTANKAMKDPSIMDRRSDGFNTVRQYVQKVRNAGGGGMAPSNSAQTGAQQPMTGQDGNPVDVPAEEERAPAPPPAQSARDVSASIMAQLSLLVQENPEEDDMRAKVQQSLNRVFRMSQPGTNVSSPNGANPTSPSSPTGSTAQNGPR